MSDKEQIENCIDIYYAGCCESDSNKIKEAFDNNAMISGYLSLIHISEPTRRYAI